MPPISSQPNAACFRTTFSLPGGFPIESGFPTPWFGAPRPVALLAREALGRTNFIPRDFCGRAGLITVCEKPSDPDFPIKVHVFAALEPYRGDTLSNEDAEALRLSLTNDRIASADGIAGLSPDEAFERTARAIDLLDGAGHTTTLWQLTERIRAEKPERIARGGGAGLNLTYAHWNKALLEAVESPTAAALLAFNKFRRKDPYFASLSPDGSLEWWIGSTPLCDAKWDGMPLSPKTTGKPVLELLLEGYDVLPDPRKTNDAWRSKAPKILKETPDWVVIEKPSGLLSVPGTQGFPDAMTLAAEMIGSPLTPVHRLDMDTSGLLVYTKHQEATKAMMAAFREGRVEKRYEALLLGELEADSGRIDLPITTNPLDRLRQCVAAGGRPSTTLWEKIALEEDADGFPLTRVKLTPVTGRTHQLRIHAAHLLGLGAPILGDPYYSPDGLMAETPETPLCLHAAELAFDDPATGRRESFSSAAPF